MTSTPNKLSIQDTSMPSPQQQHAAVGPGQEPLESLGKSQCVTLSLESGDAEKKSAVAGMVSVGVLLPAWDMDFGKLWLTGALQSSLLKESRSGGGGAEGCKNSQRNVQGLLWPGFWVMQEEQGRERDSRDQFAEELLHFGFDPPFSTCLLSACYTQGFLTAQGVIIATRIHLHSREVGRELEAVGDQLVASASVLLGTSAKMRQLKGKPKKETSKDKKERKQAMQEARQQITTVVLPTLAVVVLLIVVFVYVATRPAVT
ncbi:hypothetical protein A6R68_07072, partial [Neotoma lepida]